MTEQRFAPIWLELRARKAPWDRYVEIVAWAMPVGPRSTWGDAHKIVRTVEYERIPDGMDIAIPSFRVEDTLAQRLMDDLWNCGFRPSEGTGSAGCLAATQKHLEDMRRLVFEIQHGKEVK